MQVATKALPVLSILSGLSRHFGKNYCYPSQNKILALLAERLGVFMSIASLNRHLRVIVACGFIKRTRRIRRDPVKGLLFLSTLYEISRKGHGLLSRFRNGVGKKIQGIKKSLRERSKNGVQDPQQVIYVPEGKSYAEYLAGGGSRPSIRK